MKWAYGWLASGLLALSLSAHGALTIDKVTLNGASSVRVVPGASILVDVTETNDKGSDWRTTKVTTTPAAVNVCVDTPDHTTKNNTTWSGSESFVITAPVAYGTYDVQVVASSASDTSCAGSQSIPHTLSGGIVVVPPEVSSIALASFNPTYANKTVSWTVTFSESVSGVDSADFVLVKAGGVVGESITGVTGSGSVRTVTATTGSGTVGTLRLDLVDNDSIKSTAGNVPLGGAGTNNGNYTGPSYNLIAPVCSGADVIFCDDFERSSPGGVGNGWVVTPQNASNCSSGITGNTGCAGIDADIPPFNTLASPRANPTRSMFTRWDVVTVSSPVINLAGRVGAQLSFWMRRGGDSFSEYPEANGENYLVKYKSSDGTWKVLAQYPSGVMEGQVFTPTIELPPDALHSGFQLQFYQPSGSGFGSYNWWSGWTYGYGGAPGVVGYDYWHLDNVIVREVAAPTYTGAFCDNFEGGLTRWSVSAEGAPATGNIGDASLGSHTYASATHALDMRWGYVAASTFKTDLRGVTGNITYWLRTGASTYGSDPPESGDNLVVEYLNSAGSWTSLATYVPTGLVQTISGSHTLPSDAKHQNFRLRFRLLKGDAFDKDYWHLDNVCVGDLLPVADLSLSKTGGSLVPGSSTDYTLTVKNNGPGAMSGSLEVVDTLPVGLSYLTHAGSGWACGANGQLVTCGWAGSLANGVSAPPLVLTVMVSPSASGTLTNSATVSGTVIDSVSTNNTASYSSSLFTPAYIFTDKPCTAGVAIGQPGQPCNYFSWSPQTAGVSSTSVYITAVSTTGVPMQLSGSTATTVNMQFALTCHDPVANSGYQATFSAVGAALPLCQSNGASPTSWSTGSNLTFAAGVASVGPYRFNYGDVGQVDLYMRNSAATTQIGDSGIFVVKPYSLLLTDIKRTASPSLVNPGATTATGSQFVAAGEDFSVTVTAVNASCAASLGSYTTVGNIPSTCLATNFGREKVPVVVGLSASLVGGLGLTYNPSLNNAKAFGAFTAASATGTTFNWDDVGIITLQASVGSYLGAGAVTGLASGNVGRFYPHHFDNAITNACGTFSYSGQPFVVTVTAKSTSGATTQNYAGAFAGDVIFSDVNGASGSFSPTSFVSGKFVKGVADLSATADKVKFTYTAKLSKNSTLQLRTVESARDGVSSASGSEASMPLRSGRVRLSNIYGAYAPLKMTLETQYWSGVSWVRSAGDGCTKIDTDAIKLANGGWAATGPGTLSNGLGLISLTANGAGSASVCVDLGSDPATGVACAATSSAASSWLQSLWPPGSAYDNDPSATATFGVFSPEGKKGIYNRELY